MGVWVIVECLPSNAWGPGFHPRYCNKKKRQSREVAGEKKTRAMELSPVQN